MTEKKSQIDKFKEAAREAETDDREEAFDRTLRKVAQSPPQRVDKTKKPKPGH